MSLHPGKPLRSISPAPPSAGCEINWCGERWRLRCERVLLLPDRATALIADPHFGKAAAFRAGGVPVPDGSTRADLDRLTRVLIEERVQTLIVLGDFFHAHAGVTADLCTELIAWRNQHEALRLIIVRGNHDQEAGDPPVALRAEMQNEPFALLPFALVHHPSDPCNIARPIEIAGHVHPCVRLRDGNGRGMRSPCFVFGRHRAILPAFGGFTGGHPYRPASGERIFAIGPDRVLEVTILLQPR